MTQKVRFITIVALGFSVLTGAAATAVLADTSPVTTVSTTADGVTDTTVPGAVAPGAPLPGGQPVEQPASVTTPVPTPSATDPQKTWGWG